MLENPLFHNALGSATSGIIARILTHPLDTAKARLQAPASNGSIFPPYRGTTDVLVRTVKTEGISALYRGFGAILVGGTPGTMIYLCGYDWFKSKLHVVGSGSGSGGVVPEFAVPFFAGMLAETVACVIYVPVGIIKERLQVQRVLIPTNGTTATQPHHLYNGSLDAFRKILKTEGLAGIYRGYGATLASFGPFSAFYFVFYEQMKLWSRETLVSRRRLLEEQEEGDNSQASTSTDRNGEMELPLSYIVASSVGAGAAASWLTSPLDMAKLRIQIQRGGGRTSNTVSKGAAASNLIYLGMIDCLVQTHRVEGVRGLFRGAVARVIHCVPSMTITMTCYETCRT
eukprot:CAMPEP_0198253624 /NCGR_PEP_ID=MMETSP1447-20131203/4025_1 /TAXON_ID=420782 /ORGANISM="Chaetoceros dichaeta, Strain CCMP1751" /LENGTH=342 /DNA_ID=CAMNT_0043939365 /DNA_START=150 /DNA_END=1174 /DNA_ORIENTATION=-